MTHLEFIPIPNDYIRGYIHGLYGQESEKMFPAERWDDYPSGLFDGLGDRRRKTFPRGILPGTPMVECNWNEILQNVPKGWVITPIGIPSDWYYDPFIVLVMKNGNYYQRAFKTIKDGVVCWKTLRYEDDFRLTQTGCDILSS